MLSAAGAGPGPRDHVRAALADALGVPFDDVTVLEGDTALGPLRHGTFASRSVVATGGAAIMASGPSCARRWRGSPAHLLEARPHDIVFEDGRASVRGMPATRVTVREIAETAYSMSTQGRLPAGEDYGLESTDYYDPPAVTFANATHVAAVAVDARKGSIEFERYVVVHDCGRIINPMIVDGQVHGGVAQGIGQAVMEAMVYGADGQCHSATLWTTCSPPRRMCRR